MKKYACILIITLCLLSFPIAASADIAHETLVTHWGTIYDVQLSDVDGDTTPELLLGTESGLLVLEESTALVASFPCDIIRSVHVANIDGAGDRDVIFGCFDGNIYYFRDADFSSGPAVIPAGGRVISSAVEDIDNDGLPECVVGTVSGTVEVYGWSGSALSNEGTADLAPLGDEHNGVFDIVPVDPESDGVFDLVIGFGYMDASDNQQGYVIRLDNTLSEVWKTATSDFVVDVEVMGAAAYAATLDVSSYSLADGALLHTRSIGEFSQLATNPAGSQVYAGSRDGTVYCMNDALGAVWDSGTYIGDAVQSLVFDGTYVYAGALDAVYRFGTSSGVPNASYDDALGEVYALESTGSSLYYGTQEGELNKLFSGLYLQWAHPWYTKDKVLSVAESNGMVATASRDGGVRDYAAGTYAQVWSTMLEERATAIDAYESYQVFGSLDGSLECYNGATLLWAKSLAGAINDVEIYDVDEDGVTEVVVAVGAAGVPNLYCYTLSTGSTEWSATVPGGYVYGIGCGHDFVVACSLEVHGYDGAGSHQWNTDIGIFSSDASVDYTGDFSYAYVYSDIDNDECVVSALDLSGDVSWQYYPEQGEIITAIASGDIDADGYSEVIFSADKDKVPEVSRYLHNYLYILSSEGELEQKLEQSRDTASLDAVPLGDAQNAPVALYVGTFGVDVYATSPRFVCDVEYDFSADTMKLVFECNQDIIGLPEVTFSGAPLAVSATDAGWETQQVAHSTGMFEVAGSNILGMEGTTQCAVTLHQFNGSASEHVAHGQWQATVTTGSAVTEYMGCCAGTYDHYLWEQDRDVIGTLFNVGAASCICDELSTVDLTFTYDPSSLPEGVPESNDGLGMYYWNEEWGTYIPCEGSTVNAVSHTVTGSAPEASTYAVLTKEITIPLYKGWNLISWPRDDSMDIRTVLGDAADAVSTVYRWNTSLPTPAYEMFYVEWGVGDFSTFDPGYSYWLECVDNDYMSAMCSYSSPLTINLIEGWNLISWPKDYATPITISMDGCITNVDSIYRWVAASQLYQMYYAAWDVGDFTSYGNTTSGYWIYCLTDTTWTIE